MMGTGASNQDSARIQFREGPPVYVDVAFVPSLRCAFPLMKAGGSSTITSQVSEVRLRKSIADSLTSPNFGREAVQFSVGFNEAQSSLRSIDSGDFFSAGSSSVQTPCSRVTEQIEHPGPVKRERLHQRPIGFLIEEEARFLPFLHVNQEFQPRDSITTFSGIVPYDASFFSCGKPSSRRMGESFGNRLLPETTPPPRPQ